MNIARAAVPDFDGFVARELPQLSRYARAISQNADDAHDILVDALIKAHRNWPRIARLDEPIPYVRRIITNTMISRYRTWSHRHIFTTQTGTLDDVPSPDPSAAVDRRDALDRMMLGLPPRQRAAVVLRFYLDLDDDAIAAELQCSVSAVRSQISRALAALRIDQSRQALDGADG